MLPWIRVLYSLKAARRNQLLGVIMKVLLIGSGGREHALAWKMEQSPKVKELHCAPGNAGIANVAACVPIKADDIIGLIAKEAKAYLKTMSAPYVLKADGLAAGKGVVIPETLKEAETELEEFFSGKFGEASAKVVIEEFMSGQEVSFFAISDGKTAIPLIGAQDHKRAFDGDKGPNTGGMGAYSPAPVFTDTLREQVMDTIIHPTVYGMAKDGNPFIGVLFAGLMITAEGPKLIELSFMPGHRVTRAGN